MRNASNVNTLPLAICNTVIKQDSEGRYCLNDLHKASGGEARHKPSNFLQLEQTKELIKEIEIAGIPAIESKQGLGTYSVKQMVYAYAAWISAKFYLHVINTYDEVVTGKSSNQGQLALTVQVVTEEQIKQLIRAMYSKKEHEDDNAPWLAFYKHFSIKYIDDLPASRLEEAIKWIKGLPSPHCKERKTDYREQEFALLCRDMQYFHHATKIMSELSYRFLNGTTSVETFKEPIWEKLKVFANILGLGSSKQRVF